MQRNTTNIFGFIAVIFITLYMALLITSCNNNKNHAPNVSTISMPLQIARFDQQFLKIDSENIEKGLQNLYRQYPVFLPTYLNDILNYGLYPDSTGAQKKEVRSFITASAIRALQDTINTHFPNLDQTTKQLQQGFRYIKYYFPVFKKPRCVTFISGINNYGAVTVDSVVGIGLDMFLGKDFPFYKQVADPYPDYLIRTFEPAYIPTDVFKVIEQQFFPFNTSGGNMLEQMVDHGKQLYFLDEVMPDAPDWLKIGYTKYQISWCKDNERLIWQFFIQRNLLYINDWQQIMHYVGPGPSSEGMPAAAPGNIGSWVGWQIVRKYMKKHPEVSLKQLMNKQNAQQILRESGYKP